MAKAALAIFYFHKAQGKVKLKIPNNLFVHILQKMAHPSVK